MFRINSKYDFPWIDVQYINLISAHLEKFSWKTSVMANCRCNICGDSKKNKNKTRGFFLKREGSWSYYCHNCGASHSLRNYMELFFPSLFQNYLRDCFEERKQNGSARLIENTLKHEMTAEEKSRLQAKPLKPSIEILRCSTLKNDHEAVLYLRERHIPEVWFSSLFYVSEFGTLINSAKSASNDARIVIPLLYDKKLVGMLGRTLRDRFPRYQLHKINKELPSYFNLDHVEKDQLVMIVEGAFDSMFLKNSIAMGHCALHRINALCSRTEIKNRVLIFDNQSRNKEVMHNLAIAINKNESVCIWNRSFSTAKDINQMILTGKTDKEIHEFIINHTFSGLRAQLEFKKYCEC